MRTRLRGVCFDLDGTLADTREGIEWALRSAIDEVLPGRAATVGPVGPTIGPPVPVMLRTLVPEAPEAHEAIVAAFRTRYDAGGWRRAALYPGVREALQGLHDAGLRLDVVTNKRAAPTALVLAAHELDGLLSAVVSPDTVDPPHAAKADALGALLAEAELDPAEVAYVGDTASDREAAYETGCPFVAVAWGYGRAGDGSFPGDLGVLSDPAQLLSLLLPLAGGRQRTERP